MSEKNAPYLVYTDDEDFVLNKEDINSGGGSGGNSDIVKLNGILNLDQSVSVSFTYSELKNYLDNSKVVFLFLLYPSDVGYTILTLTDLHALLTPFENTYNAIFNADIVFTAQNDNDVMQLSEWPTSTPTQN